jgi:ankyrin repeat protein
MSDLALIKASIKGKLADVRRLLATGHNVDERGQAIDKDELKKLIWVLNEAGVDAVGDAMGRTIDITPLMAAAEGGSLEIVDALLEAGADVNAEDSLKRTPLMFAITWKQSAISNKLLAAGAKSNAKHLGGETVLTQAISAGMWELAHSLLDAGAPSHPKGKKACAPLYAAAYQDDAGAGPMILRLLDAGATLTDADSLNHAVGHQDADVVERLLETHPTLMKKICPDKLLGVAAKARNAKVLETLLERGIKPTNDPNERSPLTDTIIGPARSSLDFHKPEFIVDEREIKCLAILVIAGANVNHIADDGSSPLGWAVSFYRSGLVKWLLEHGADPNLPSHGDSPLEKAHEKLEEAQPTYRLEPHEEDEFHALAAEAKKIIKLLKSHGAKRELQIAPHEPEEETDEFVTEALNTPVAKRRGLCCRTYRMTDQLLIHAKIDDITAAIEEQRNVERVERDVFRRLREFERPVGHVMAVVKLKGHDWVYTAGGTSAGRESLLKKLSKSLKCRIIKFNVDDEMGVLSYQLFDSGKCIESFSSDGQWFRGGVDIDPELQDESERMLGTEFTSSIRKAVAVNWNSYRSEWEFVDRFLREHDAYVPFMWAGFNGPDSQLRLTSYHDDEIKAKNVERVDLVFYEPTAAQLRVAEQKPPEEDLLYVAIRDRDDAAAIELIAAGADVNQMPTQGIDSYLFLAIQFACWDKDNAIVNALLAAGADPNFSGNSEPILPRLVQYDGPLVEALSRVVQLLEHGADINSRRTEKVEPSFFAGGQTALIKAAALCRVPMVKLLLKCGADPTIVDHDGKTALDQAESWLHIAKQDQTKKVPAWSSASKMQDSQEIISLLEAALEKRLDLNTVPEPLEIIAELEKQLAASPRYF